ncbi:heterokaryon incompatibility protein-domain-containing protein [Hypoxylon sp. FL1284]|nr:heterokaryon incompatibility protein-domain-containing protein [Hypoxylon sp. FL1284]
MDVFGYEPYTYPSSLTVRRIRLIKMLPPTRAACPPFRVVPRMQIVEYDLDLSPDCALRYEALSYTWNARRGEQPSWLVRVETEDGPRGLLVHKNLHLALRALWESRLTALSIFADQICINQKDISEREFHVRLMGEIYSRCTRVIVWLGLATTSSNTLFKFAKTVGREAEVRSLLTTPPRERLRITDAVVNRTCNENDELLKVVDRLGSRFPVAGYIDVLRRSWFTRLWIIQEASLAPDGVLLCGNKTFTFDDFRALFFFHSISSRVWNKTRDKAVSAAEMRLRDSIFQLERPFVRIFSERMAIHQAHTRRSLYELVKKYNVNEDDDKVGSTEPEDRIFGLLGLADLDGSFPKTDIGNPKKVYIKFAEEVIRNDRDILCFSQGGKRLKDLPSWVPDWSTPEIRLPYGYATLTSESVYKAGASLPDRSPKVGADGTLCILGVVVGGIVEIGKHDIRLEDEPLTINKHDFSSLAAFFGEIDSFLEKASMIPGAFYQYDKDEDGRLRASLELTDGGLTARQFPDSDPDHPPLKELRDELCRFSDKLIRVRKTAATYTSFSQAFRKHRPQPGRWAQALPMLSIFPLIFSALDTILAVASFWIYLRLQPLRRWLAGVPPTSQNATDPNGIVDMRLHRTEKMFEYKVNIFRNHGRKLYLTDGGLVGLGPAEMALGDTVVIVPGGSVPHVMRLSKSSAAQGLGYHLGNAGSAEQDKPAVDCAYVGEAYCHGAMDGEFMVPGVQECILRIS